jgi:hypothetical protein
MSFLAASAAVDSDCTPPSTATIPATINNDLSDITQFLLALKKRPETINDLP